MFKVEMLISPATRLEWCLEENICDFDFATRAVLRLLLKGIDLVQDITHVDLVFDLIVPLVVSSTLIRKERSERALKSQLIRSDRLFEGDRISIIIFIGDMADA